MHDRARWCASVVQSGRLQDQSRASRSRLLLASRGTFAQRDEAPKHLLACNQLRGYQIGARACDRAASRSAALPRLRETRSLPVAVLFYLHKCLLELLLPRVEHRSLAEAARGKRLKTPPRERSYEWRADVFIPKPGCAMGCAISPRNSTCTI